MRVDVQVLVLPHGQGLPLPAWQTEGSAGADLHAAITETRVLAPGERTVIPTGLCVALPPDFELQVRPRSGLAVRYGITVLNAPGTIDSDYRGEIQVPLINHGQEPFKIERGDRIAQIVLAPVTRPRWVEVPALTETGRGSQGFGSTGR